LEQIKSDNTFMTSISKKIDYLLKIEEQAASLVVQNKEKHDNLRED